MRYQTAKAKIKKKYGKNGIVRYNYIAGMWEAEVTGKFKPNGSLEFRCKKMVDRLSDLFGRGRR